ncbi:MAG: leucyl aminopeptidase [Geminicoccaceae bacterium]|nr:leucyl aminopeptidase [Geminicoccaceae bacterium]
MILIDISLQDGVLEDSSTVVVLIGDDGNLSTAARTLDANLGGFVSRLIESSGELKHGKLFDSITPAGAKPDRVVVLCIANKDAKPRTELEDAGAGLFLKLSQLGVDSACVGSSEGLDGAGPAVDVATALATGARLRSYRFDRYRHETEDEKSKLKAVRFAGLGGDAADAFERTGLAVEAVALTRDLVSEPANVLYPQSFAERCMELERFGIEVEILTPDKLADLKMGAILAVGQGSSRPPYAVAMRWNGGGKDEAPLALVGKGVCFDTGGISLKPPAGMEDMKWDMGGAGAVVGAMQAVASRKAKANVVGVIGLAENMPSGTAQRPGDVVTAMSGTTIEVINTDAEGRLVLADMLWYTKERFKPKAIIDFATLTGAIIVALGHEHAGLFANDDALAKAIAEAGEAVGDTVWRMPLGAAYDKHIKSDIADIKNVGRAREAGATAGAVFLQRFVGDVPWAHLDIAAMAWSSRDKGIIPKGGTGYGVRLIDRLVADCYESRS